MSILFDVRKGDLAFWYNIDRNLNVDYLTFHGGCPVLVGSKWITNKWIRCISTLSIFVQICLTQVLRQGVRPVGPVQVRGGRVQEAADAADPGVGRRPLQNDALLRRVAVVRRVFAGAPGVEGHFQSGGHSPPMVAAEGGKS